MSCWKHAFRDHGGTTPDSRQSTAVRRMVADWRHAVLRHSSCSGIHGKKRLIDRGLMSATPHVQFVMGVKNAMPAEERLPDIQLAELKQVIPDAT